MRSATHGGTISLGLALLCRMQDIYGGVCPGERRAIYHLIAFFKPRRLLEIGTHIGASTLVIAQSLASHGAPESQLITGDILDVNNPQQGAFSNLGTLSPLDGLRAGTGGTGFALR